MGQGKSLIGLDVNINPPYCQHYGAKSTFKWLTAEITFRYIQNMTLTPIDLNKIKNLINTTVNPRFAEIDERLERLDKRFEKIDERFEKIDERFEKIDEKMGGLLTRDEFLNKMDEVITELQTTRQEQVFISHRIPNLEDRVSALEKIHPQGKHP